MSKAEEIIKTRLKRLLKAQGSYILSDKTLNNNQKMEQMMIIEELMDVLNKKEIINDMNMHEYTTKRIIAQDEMDKIEKEDFRLWKKIKKWFNILVITIKGNMK